VKKIAADRDQLVIDARRFAAETAVQIAAPAPAEPAEFSAASVFSDAMDSRDE
jgi:hypothetical protein